MEKLRPRNIKDQSAKTVFGNPEFCAQFLNDYVDIDCLKGLQSEQIEDITNRFVSMWDNERDSDVVKKILLPDQTNLYVIAIIEHQSVVDFSMAMKLLRYMVMIWTDYEKEQDAIHKGISKTKDFVYPPILPIIYYEDEAAWTAATYLSDRIALSDLFGDYIPNFRYEVIRLHDYTDDEIASNANELSLVMLFNKLRNSGDFKNLKKLSPEYIQNLQNHADQDLLDIAILIVSALMHKLNIPTDEIANVTDLITERRFPMLFDSFEAYDVQEERKRARSEGFAEGRSEGRAIGRAEACAESLIKLLASKGTLSNAIKEQILNQKDIQVLDQLFDIALRINNTSEFESEFEMLQV